jgi:hypothetical protein
MSFHEIGGLIVCGLFLIHKGLNWKWIKAATKKLFDKTLPFKTRAGYIVNVLLLVTMTFIALSGVMISKTLFRGMSGGGMFWRSGHYFAAAVGLVLVGIHIGLHWSFIKNMFSRILKIPRLIAKPIGIICLVIILSYGVYSSVSTNFANWISGPFAVYSDNRLPEKDKMTSGLQSDEFQQGRREGEKPEGLPNGSDKKDIAPGNGERRKPGESNGIQALNFGRILNIIVSYGSISCVFAAITVLIEKIFKRRRKSAGIVS